MQNFRFICPTDFIFGKNTENSVGEEIKKYGKRILLHYGGGHIKKNGLYDRIIRSLEENKIEFVELGGVKANPDVEMVREGIRLCREEKLDFILAAGGGSVIDSAKAIAMGVSYSGDVWDFFVGKSQIEEALPVGVILTIPATGSEASNTTVVTNSEGGHSKRAAS